MAEILQVNVCVLIVIFLFNCLRTLLTKDGQFVENNFDNNFVGKKTHCSTLDAESKIL